MKGNKQAVNRDKWLHLRLTEQELQTLKRRLSGTTEHKLSAYCRKLLLGKPMIAKTRNATADDLLREFSRLLKDLNGIANNYNQTVHKLHTLETSGQYRQWLIRQEPDRQKLLRDVEEMKEFMLKAAAVWLRL